MILKNIEDRSLNNDYKILPQNNVICFIPINFKLDRTIMIINFRNTDNKDNQEQGKRNRQNNNNWYTYSNGSIYNKNSSKLRIYFHVRSLS